MAKKMLVVYYSWSNGNTKRIAEELASACGADLARIETVTPYPEDYQTTVDQGKREVDEGYQPPIQDLDANIDDYDVIAVGTPTWWYTMAPAVSTFLSEADLEGKTVVPFMTCGGWPGTVIDDMERDIEEAGGTPKLGFEVTFDSSGGNRLESDQSEIDEWVARVKKLLR